jgi:hypothetical protein
MSSYANPAGYNFATTAGTLVNQGIGGLVDLGNKYKDNESISGLVTGSIADTFRTQANTGLAIQYNDAFLGSLGNFQRGLENVKTGNTLKLMGAEGAINRDLIGFQGEQQRSAIRETGTQDRLGYQTQGEQQRLTVGAQGAQDRLGYVTQGEQQRLGIGEQGVQNRLTVAAQGQQEREILAEKGSQELRLRADARGAVRNQGARFYG